VQSCSLETETGTPWNTKPVCWSLTHVLVKSEWNAIQDLFWHAGAHVTILLTFNFNLEGYCTSSWHRIIGEHIGNVGTPGIAGDTRYASGPPRAGVIIASCRVRKLTFVGTEKWRSTLGRQYGISEPGKQHYCLWRKEQTQKVQFLGMRYINKKFLPELTMSTAQTFNPIILSIPHRFHHRCHVWNCWLINNI
jgi:hypothetical protein